MAIKAESGGTSRNSLRRKILYPAVAITALVGCSKSADTLDNQTPDNQQPHVSFEEPTTSTQPETPDVYTTPETKVTLEPEPLTKDLLVAWDIATREDFVRAFDHYEKVFNQLYEQLRPEMIHAIFSENLQNDIDKVNETTEKITEYRPYYENVNPGKRYEYVRGYEIPEDGEIDLFQDKGWVGGVVHQTTRTSEGMKDNGYMFYTLRRRHVEIYNPTTQQYELVIAWLIDDIVEYDYVIKQGG